MAAIVELIPLIQIDGALFVQPTDSVVDVSGYTEGFVQWTIAQISRNGQPVIILVQTAIDNREEAYMTIASVTYAADPAVIPHLEHLYLAGSTNGASSAPGFARYLRIRVDQDPGASITIQAKAVLKP